MNEVGSDTVFVYDDALTFDSCETVCNKNYCVQHHALMIAIETADIIDQVVNLWVCLNRKINIGVCV